jgi:lipopolysaccharide-induced tumor necrosis factor-alpha factor
MEEAASYQEKSTGNESAPPPPPYTEAQFHVGGSAQQHPPIQSGSLYPQQIPYLGYVLPPELQQQQQQPNVLIIPGPPSLAFGTAVHFGDRPQQCKCPNCRADVLTMTKHNTGVITWLLAGGLCLIGCVLGCCLIPFCLNGKFNY